MKLNIRDAPRLFDVGIGKNITISDYGDIYLSDDEQVTFVRKNSQRFDFVAKSWGYYVTPSINGRLKSEGFKVALVRNAQGRLYVMAVDASKMRLFEAYCKEEQQDVVEWLDSRQDNQ